MARSFFFLLLLFFADLHAGTLTVSGEAGKLVYRMEQHETLMGDWVTAQMGRMLEPVTVRTGSVPAWVTLFFYAPDGRRLHLTEVFVAPEDSISLGYFYDPADLDRIVANYDHHPAPLAQVCFDSFMEEVPINQVSDFTYRYLDTIAAFHPGEGRFSELVDRAFCPDTTGAAGPYRQRLRYRIYSILPDLLQTGEVLPSLDSMHRVGLANELFTYFDPEGPGVFHGRFWRGYRMVQALWLEDDGEAPTCGGRSYDISTWFIRILRFREESWFPYLYAGQLQSQKETFSAHPDFFVEELDFFRCLDLNMGMVKLLEAYYP